MNAAEFSKIVESGAARAVVEALRLEPSLVGEATADGDAPLHLACWQKHLAVVEVLLSFNADVNARGCYRRTPLHYAVHDGTAKSVPIVRRLLEAGADPAATDENGFDVETWARREMWDEALDAVVDLLGGTPVVRAQPPADFAGVVAMTQAIEATSHMQVALSRLLTSFLGGDLLAAADLTHDLPAADVLCLEDLRRVLETLASTSWGPPLREWLQETSKPAHLIALLDRYNAGDGVRRS